MYNQVLGAGTTNNKNVFRIEFSEELSSPPIIEAWDDEDFLTTNKIFFTGIKPLIAMVDTNHYTDDWWNCDVYNGGRTYNRLKGNNSYLQFYTMDKIQQFNIAIEIPKDMSIFNDFVVLRVVYTFSGDEPNVVWRYNIGQEETPVWKNLMLNKNIRWNDRNISTVIIHPFVNRYAEEVSIEI